MQTITRVISLTYNSYVYNIVTVFLLNLQLNTQKPRHIAKLIFKIIPTNKVLTKGFFASAVNVS